MLIRKQKWGERISDYGPCDHRPAFEKWVRDLSRPGGLWNYCNKCGRRLEKTETEP